MSIYDFATETLFKEYQSRFMELSKLLPGKLVAFVAFEKNGFKCQGYKELGDNLNSFLEVTPDAVFGKEYHVFNDEVFGIDCTNGVQYHYLFRMLKPGVTIDDFVPSYKPHDVWQLTESIAPQVCQTLGWKQN